MAHEVHIDMHFANPRNNKTSSIGYKGTSSEALGRAEVVYRQHKVFRTAHEHGALDSLLLRPGNPVLEVPAALSIGHFSQILACRSSIEVNLLEFQQYLQNPSATVQVGQGN